MKNAFLLLFFCLPLFLSGCSGSASPDNSDDNSDESPKGGDSIDDFFLSLEKELEGIARKCHYKSRCYYAGGIDYIELEACRGREEPLFKSEADCHDTSIEVLEDIAADLKLKDSLRWKPRRRKSRSRGSSGGSSGGGSGGGSILGSLTRETFAAFCRLPSSQCGSLTYDDLTASPPSRDDICLSKYDGVRRILDPDADCSSFVQPPPAGSARIQTETGACPTQGGQIHSIPDANQLGEISPLIIGGGDEYHYHKSSFIKSSGGAAIGSDKGSFDPDQDIVRAYIDLNGAANIWLDKDLIPGFDKNNSWFIYGDSPGSVTVLSSVSDSEYSAGGINYHKFSLSAALNISIRMDIFVAYQSGGNCHYLLPPAAE